jgi:hypothetical protein
MGLCGVSQELLIIKDQTQIKRKWPRFKILNFWKTLKEIYRTVRDGKDDKK